MPRPLKLNVFLFLLLFLASCLDSNTSKNKATGIGSLLFGKTFIYFPEKDAPKAWTNNISEQTRTQYAGKKFRIGKSIGEGSFGKVYELKKMGIVDSKFVVKLLKTQADCNVLCSQEFDFHQSLVENEIPTTGAIIGKYSDPDMGNYTVIIKEKVKGTTLRKLYRDPDWNRGLRTIFAEFKNRLRDGQLKLLKGPDPKFLVDIGEQHFGNIMMEERTGRFVVVDGDLLGFKKFRQYLDSVARSRNKDFMEIGNLLTLRYQKKLKIVSEHIDTLMVFGTFRKLHLRKPKNSCSILDGLDYVANP